MPSVKRIGVFETNSSSTHSIVIPENILAATKQARDQYRGGKWVNFFTRIDGYLVIHDGEFGWERMAYDDPQTKASYLATWAHMHDDDEAKKTIKEAIAYVCGIPIDQVSLRSGAGYIDHQSDDVATEALIDVDTCAAFIFGGTLYTANDNSYS